MTFDELGIPFPLFAADVRETDEYVGPGTCSLCAAREAHVFSLAHDGALVVRCPVCAVDRHARHPDDADDDASASCDVCGTAFELPPAPILVCHACLRAGRAVFAQATTEGFVDLDAVRLGHAHGGQGFTSAHFPTVEVDLRTGAVRPPPPAPYPEHERRVRHFAARIPVDQMIELLRTPPFIGQPAWPFHCARTMVFLGSWTADDDHPDELAAMLADVFAAHPRVCCYVWRCPSCEALTWQTDR